MNPAISDISNYKNVETKADIQSLDEVCAKVSLHCEFPHTEVETRL